VELNWRLSREKLQNDYLSLESAEQMTEIGMLGAQSQDFSLDHGALDVVVFQYHVLLQAFDGKV
jgi:hypothetical protein